MTGSILIASVVLVMATVTLGYAAHYAAWQLHKAECVTSAQVWKSGTCKGTKP